MVPSMVERRIYLQSEHSVSDLIKTVTFSLSAKDIVTEDKPDLVQHNMLAEVKKQPYRSAYDKLVRYEGLNCRFRPTPKNATYFLADMGKSFFFLLYVQAFS